MIFSLFFFYAYVYPQDLYSFPTRRSSDLLRIPPVRVAQRPAPGKPSNQLIRTLENSVLFENDGLLVINKPPGLAVHGGSGVSLGLIEVLRLMRPEARYLELVHRLDRGTSRSEEHTSELQSRG